MTAPTLDQARAEAFMGKMVEIVTGGYLSLMVSVGHQTELFDTLATLPPSTSEQIAQAAHLNERYVREWLGAMVTGRIIEYDTEHSTYVLPSEHAAALTRAAGIGNMASEAQNIAMLGNVEEDLIRCFREGGGVPYARYPRFQQVMAEFSGAILDATLLETTLPAIPGLIERLRSGIDVLDVGCGRGHAINLMAQAFPKSCFTGYDFSSQGIAEARAEVVRMGLTNARFEVADAATLDAPSQFDLITAFDAIHDQAQPTRVLKAIAEALRPDGVFLMVDVAASSQLHENLENPFAPMFYSVSCMHCMTVSLALGGEGLGAMWGEQQARQKLSDAGFMCVEVLHLESDPFNNYYVARMG